MSAQTRAQLHLIATTMVNADDTLEQVKLAAGQVKGGGASLLTTGIQNIGAQVNVERETAGRLVLSITSGRRLVELCTFSAVAGADGGVTRLKVGGLETYKTTQSTVIGFIPAGPKMIAGYAPYKRFLEQVAVALRAADPAVQVAIA
jgi:hypothetical protein